MGTGLHSLCGLEGCADYTVLERRGGVEGVAGGTHVAPQPRQCCQGRELIVGLLQGGFVDGMWKEQILRKRRKRRKG